MEKTAVLFSMSLQERLDALSRIDGYREGLVEHNPGLILDITDQFKF